MKWNRSAPLAGNNKSYSPHLSPLLYMWFAHDAGCSLCIIYRGGAFPWPPLSAIFTDFEHQFLARGAHHSQPIAVAPLSFLIRSPVLAWDLRERNSRRKSAPPNSTVSGAHRLVRISLLCNLGGCKPQTPPCMQISHYIARTKKPKVILIIKKLCYQH